MTNGVLPYQEIKDLINSRVIKIDGENLSFMNLLEDENPNNPIGLASFEPSLGNRVFAMPASILPCEDMTLLDRLEKENLYNFELNADESRFLPFGNVFVILLNESLSLHQGFIGESTGRSSVGRTNTILKLLTDNHSRYNFIPDGYKGRLFLEVFPSSFPIIIRKGLRLNQIKFAFKDFGEIDEATLEILHDKSPLLYDEFGNPLSLDNRIEKDSIVMDLKLNGNSPSVYKAKRNVLQGLDLSRNFKNRENRYKLNEFFEEVLISHGRVIVNPGEFYIMITRQRISVPPEYVTKMIPYDSNLADLKTQEADLFNPGHGFKTRGFCPVLEIKAYAEPMELRDGFPICRIKYQKLRSAPSKKGYDEVKESYVGQERANPGNMFD